MFKSKNKFGIKNTILLLNGFLLLEKNNDFMRAFWPQEAIILNELQTNETKYLNKLFLFWNRY